MSKQTFPVFVDQPGCTIHNFSVTGATVGATAATTGLDGRGKFLCTIWKAANVVTVDWKPAFGDRPYIFFQIADGVTNTAVEIVTSTATQLVYRTVVQTTNAGVNDINLDIIVCSYNTTSFVS
jgi:hypothetical protein